MFSKYRYVYAVYKEGNFTKAAEKLFISQPSLSAAIKKVEETIGATLFERTGVGVELTEVGKEYIAAAEKIINIESDFNNRVNDIYNLETGSITVGGTNYLSSYILPEIINSFTALHPKIDVELVEANSTSLCNMIKNEQIDVIIDSFDESMDEYMGYPLASEKILLCVPEDREINDKLRDFHISPDKIFEGSIDLNKVPPVSIKMFAQENFILLKKGNDMYNRSMALFERNNIVPKVSFYVDQLNISSALVSSGMGLCFITDTFFRYSKFYKNVCLYNVGEDYSRVLYVAHKRNKYCTRAMSEFIKTAKEVICIDHTNDIKVAKQTKI